MPSPCGPTKNLAAVESRVRLEANGRAWTLERDAPPLRFGRAPDNDLALGDDFTSRHHGWVVWDDGGFVVVDDSRNGTFVAFVDGPRARVHHDRCVLDRQGTLHLGHPNSVAIVFTIEIRTAADEAWHSPVRRDGHLIRRDGEYWTLRYEGRVLQLKDSRGVHYLAQLLWHPGREFHALDLVALVPARGAGSGATVVGMATSGGVGPALDAAARADYRHRLGELRDELREAEDRHDVGRIPVLRAEIEALAEQLAGAVGLGGRDRETASNADRARVAVTQRVKEVVRAIARHDAALGHHLTTTVRTGRFCSYRTDATAPAHWEGSA